MEKLICDSCGAALVPDATAPHLTCAYCGTPVTNPHYDATLAAAVPPDLATLCLETLAEMGKSENLSQVDGNCFGQPILQNYTVRDAMGVPAQEKLYFLYDRTTLILGTLKEGFALGSEGLYYKCGDEHGHRSWEAFITGAVACVDRAGSAEGRLNIGTSLTFAVTSEAESRLARFLVDYHNHVYQQYTGKPAPDSWTVAAPDGSVTQTEAESPSLVQTLLTAAGTLLGSATAHRHTPTLRRTVHTPVQHRPTKLQPVHRPQPVRTPVQRPQPAHPTLRTPASRPQQPHMQRPSPAGPARDSRAARPSPGGRRRR